VFDDPIRSALHRLKYKRDMGLGDSIAAQMADFVRTFDWPIEVVVPIPLSAARRRERGYNQVGLIAHPLALALGLSYASNALVRWRNTHSQVGLSREQRRENVRGVFRGNGTQIRGKTILLLDDVATTGSTLISGADALLAAGASQVYAFTVARALTRHGLHHA
jgi:ComF family protein